MLSTYAIRKLAQARKYNFGRPVTAYLVNARFCACSCIAQTYGHMKAWPGGMFADGHDLWTSNIFQVDWWPGFWAFHTQSGSYYVVATFERRTGKRSLEDLLRVLMRGVNPGPQLSQ
ncbi:hypothetical protein [Pseudomonas sp. LP_7_YM]|uniref:hypothetical protein n=1 Tax=Pseudomonas sp. LP_7_YM TaxID=2485137 RepID=UPI0010602520|nr:hypothetical protein [Pseudomonas sp. LP_7_YM]TDV58889.1 hypothetical protein EC915_1229 [Pseudomonas sp. LP_7_YM]